MRKPPARAVHGAHRGSRASAQRGMFANKVTFMQSVFSPSRPPLSVRYAHATSSKPAPPDFKKQEVVRSRNIAALGADVLEHVVAACWQSCERAPFCASVSKEFQHASVQAAKTLAAVDVIFTRSTHTCRSMCILHLCRRIPRTLQSVQPRFAIGPFWEFGRRVSSVFGSNS